MNCRRASLHATIDICRECHRDWRGTEIEVHGTRNGGCSASGPSYASGGEPGEAPCAEDVEVCDGSPLCEHEEADAQEVLDEYAREGE